jgi:hypothetical protein
VLFCICCIFYVLHDPVVVCAAVADALMLQAGIPVCFLAPQQIVYWCFGALWNSSWVWASMCCCTALWVHVLVLRWLSGVVDYGGVAC